MAEGRAVIEAGALHYEAPGSGATLLKGIDLRIGRGERVGLVGPSGAGKTTLGYHLCGVHHLALQGRSTGRLRLDGQDALAGGRRGFGGLVLQNPENQIFCSKVEEEVALGLPKSTSGADLTALLEQTGLQARRHQDTATLSLGWKQRLSIAGMLALAPSTLLLDEPTNFLDGAAADALFDLLSQLGETTLLVADHDEARLLGWADRMIRLEDGVIVQDCPVSAYRGFAPLASRTTTAASGGLLLEMEHVHYAYQRAVPVLADFSLSLREGEAVALLGANGSGKSTLLRLAKGLLKPDSGQVRLASGGALMREVGLVFQNPEDGLFAPSVQAECAFLPANLGLDRPRERAREVLDRLGMGGFSERVPFSLSYGEKRRVSLASVLSGGARILCLDEPTVGLDRANLEILADLLRDQVQKGVGVIFATHDPAFAAAVATRSVRLGAAQGMA